jgi:hypothetical protein
MTEQQYRLILRWLMVIAVGVYALLGSAVGGILERLG